MRPRVVVMAQLPPPYHGQAVMQRHLVDASWGWCDKIHVPMRFSDDLASVARFRLAKLWRLTELLLRFLRERAQGPVDLLYYPPAGASWTGILRDLLVLLVARPLSRRVLFHFHAGGFDSSLKGLPGPLRALAIRVFSAPDLAIVLSESLAGEVAVLRPRRITVVPNGICDVFPQGNPARNPSDGFRVLYVGTLSRAKGIDMLLHATAELVLRGANPTVSLLGDFDDEAFRTEVEGLLGSPTLSGRVTLHGTVTGSAKWDFFARSDVFCFPTHYARENQPVAVIEAMMAGLPVVATRWRALADMLEDGIEGILFPANNGGALVEALERLAQSPGLRDRLGKAARTRFESSYRLESHLHILEQLAQSAVTA